ncbi:MAG: penicillin-binding protein 2 [Elusimicrobiota bacterium]
MLAKFRIIFILLGLFVLYAGLGVRLFHIQINCHAKYSEMAKDNYSVHISRVSPYRGEICDRNGVQLAINKHTYSVGFNYKYGAHTEEMKKAVLGSLKVDISKFEDSNDFVWYVRHVDPQDISGILEYRKDGLVIVKENSRYYPKAPMAAQVIGCVGTDNQGLSGIEYNFDDQLKDKVADCEFLRDAKGRIVNLSSRDDSSEDSVSKIYLTIDANLQYIAERELMSGFKKYKPKWGLAIIQNPSNGHILAMAQYPSFDNNSLVVSDVEALKNMSVSNIFEPGSTFKIVTAAAAIEEKLIKTDEIIDCENGEYEVGGFPIRDFKPYEKLTFENCMVHSSNIALAKVGARLGRRLLYKYARDFGFGNFTGIRLPGEPRGILRKPDRWSGTSVSRIAFGQEIGVTALQLVGAFSVIANGGLLYEPRIIDRIVINDKSREFESIMIRRVVSAQTAETITGMMKKVVEEGSGMQAAVEGYKVAGKTGTAQKYNPDTQTYKEDKYIALFGGFVPAETPELTIIVAFDEPETELYWGGYVAAPVFSAIARAALNYMNIPPSGVTE